MQQEQQAWELGLVVAELTFHQRLGYWAEPQWGYLEVGVRVLEVGGRLFQSPEAALEGQAVPDGFEAAGIVLEPDLEVGRTHSVEGS